MDKMMTGAPQIQKNGNDRAGRAAGRLHPLYTVAAEMDKDPAGVLYSARYEPDEMKVLVKAISTGVEIDKDAFDDPPPDCLALQDSVTGVDGRPLVVLEFPKASSLKRVLDRQGKMSVRPSVSLIMKLLASLQYLHERGRVFATLSSSSVSLSRVTGGRLKLQLAYFGLNSDGRCLCPLEYRPPERQAAEQVPDVSDDLFAAAVLLYEMLFGVMPFAASGGELYGKKRPKGNEALYLPESFETAHPLESAVLRRALHENPAERFESAAKLQVALLGKAEGTRSSAPFLPPPLPKGPGRSSIPTVPSPPRDSLISEARAHDEDVTKPYSIPAVEAYRSRRSDAGLGGGRNLWTLIAVGLGAMMLPIVVWLILGGSLTPASPSEPLSDAPVSTVPGIEPARSAVENSAETESSAPSSAAVVGSDSAKAAPLNPVGASAAKSGREDPTQATAPSEKKHPAKKKPKDEKKEVSGPADNLSSNPFPLKHNPFPNGASQ